MISFFRVNDPLRLLTVLFLLFLFRLPVFIAGFDLLSSELSWMIIGEKLNEGFTMYKDIQSNLGFLSALMYKTIDSLFGRSQLAYHILATTFIGVQAISINGHFNKNDVIREKGYVPAFFYILLSFAFVDFYTLSPVLMSLTFLIPALGQVLSVMKDGGSETSVLKIGIYTGLASLFYLPSITLLFTFLLIFLLFSKADLRNYILIILGYLFPVALFGMYFYWIGFFDEYFYDLFYYSMGLNKVKFMSLTEVILALSPVIAITSLALIKVLTSSGFINFQQRCHAAMSLWLVGSAISLLLSSHFSAYSIMLILPPSVYFISNFYLLAKKRIFQLVTFTLFPLSILFFAYMGVLFDLSKHLNQNRMFVGSSPIENQSKKVLVLGDDLSHFKGNKIATSLVNWHLDEKMFEDFSQYKNIISFNERIQQDKPDIIVDQYNNMPTIINRIPALSLEYTKGKEGFYYLK